MKPETGSHVTFSTNHVIRRKGTTFTQSPPEFSGSERKRLCSSVTKVQGWHKTFTLVLKKKCVHWVHKKLLGNWCFWSLWSLQWSPHFKIIWWTFLLLMMGEEHCVKNPTVQCFLPIVWILWTSLSSLHPRCFRARSLHSEAPPLSPFSLQHGHSFALNTRCCFSSVLHTLLFYSVTQHGVSRLHRTRNHRFIPLLQSDSAWRYTLNNTTWLKSIHSTTAY